ncbi:MAG TPA: NirA family protein [Candidatus Saccharimonadales bacterium]|nr:NirA family protein [Candidatus Saccharimonadales bacterium]
MKKTLPFDEVAGEKLTHEQSAYLDGFFAGLRNRGFSFAELEANPALAANANKAVNLDELIPEERIKHELHPLDAYPLLLQHSAGNQAPDKENTFRFKWQGLFYLAPHKDGFMARLRIPGGQLTTHQLRELARVAQELTSGYVQITTRANLQMRLIEPKDAPEVLRRIQGVGLHTRGAGADNIRNLTTNPTAGIDPDELFNALPLTHQLAQFILNHREFYDLPRKFNVAIDGGGIIGAVEDTNDIGLRATRVVEGGLVPAGIYFRVALGGATGHKAFARDLGVLVKPEEVLAVVAALLRVFIANGNRSDRKKARLKHLLESWSLERYLAETEKLLAYQLLRAPIGLADLPRSEHSVPHSHVGVYPQKQKGLNYIGAAVPVGQITPRQMIRLSEIADLYGSGEVRLTVWQNFIIPNVPDAFVETAKKALFKLGFDWEQSNLKSGFIACTGNSYCKFASSNTKRDAIELMDWLDKRFELDQPINVHLTGCPNSCAQHYMGDIGLLGTKVKISGETLEGYHIFVGGGFGDKQAVGRQLFSGVSVNSLKPAMEKIIAGWLQHRQAGESFQAFANRHDIGRLQEILA